MLYAESHLGLVHKLRLQVEVVRQSKNVKFEFYKVETFNEVGAGGPKKSQKLVNVVCERPLSESTGRKTGKSHLCISYQMSGLQPMHSLIRTMSHILPGIPLGQKPLTSPL